MEHGKGSELLDDQQRASRDDAKKNIFFLMLNAGHPVCRSPIPFNQIIVDKRYWQRYLSIVGSSLFKIHMSLHLSSKFWKFWHSDVKYVVKIPYGLHGKYNEVNNGSHLLPDPKCTCNRCGFPREYPGTFLFLFVICELIFLIWTTFFSAQNL